jgi:hypothetical protein
VVKPLYRLLRFKRSHINGEAILHIGLEQSVISLVDLLDGDDFYIGGDVMFATKVEHFLCLGNASDGRAREAATPQQETKGGDGKRFRRCADKGYVAVAAKELDVGVNVVFGRDSVEDEVKAAGVLLHLVSITGNNNIVSA